MHIDLKKFNLMILFATLLAVFTATFFAETHFVLQMSEFLAKLCTNCLRIVAVPLVFFSILSTLEHIHRQKNLGVILRPTLLYTLLFTTLASVTALLNYLFYAPYRLLPIATQNVDSSTIAKITDATTLVNFLVPDNFLRPFLEGNIFSVLFLTLIVFWSTLKAQEKARMQLIEWYTTIFQLLQKMMSTVIYLMPFGVWAFVVQFILDVRHHKFDMAPIMLYFGSILSANLIHGIIVVPLFMRWRKVPILRTLKEVAPALFFGFFSRSSSATLPITMECTERVGVNPIVARFVLPLCTAVNMNGCAAFIFTTVAFVLEANGLQHGFLSLIPILFLSIFAAMGNSAVPMGCYLMASSILSTTHVPMNLMGLILPIYTLIDMMETPLNIWSNIGIASIINQKKYSLLD